MNDTSDKTVLIVNDSADQREMMRIIFEQAGCRALTASGGREAFRLAEETRLDLIISDVTMPDGDGIELCRRIRSDGRLRSLPILLVSGLRRDANHIVEGLEAGADDYIELPIDPLKLIVRAERLIERRRTEDARRASENYFRSLIENISDIISILSLDGTILYESPSVEQKLGYQPEELIGRHGFDFVHPEDVEKVISYFQTAIENPAESVAIEYRFKHKNGSWLILESIGRILDDPISGSVVIITSRDFSERRQAEKALRESESQLQTIFDNAAIGIALSNLRGFPIKTNPALRQMLGYSAEELGQKSLIKITHAEDIVKTELLLEELFQGERNYFQVNKRYIKKNGEEMWGNLTVSTVPAESGEPQFVLAMIEDITKRKRAEQVLRESEENFRALVQATTQFVWTLREDGDGDVIQWWMDLTGLTFGEMKGAGWLGAVHPEDRETAGAVWQNAFANRILFDTSYRVLTKTGEYRHYAVRGVPVFNADDSFRQWIGTFNDITELKQAEEALARSEEQLRQSQKLESVGRLAGGIAHDFNNMLTAINGYSELTLRKLDADNPLRRNIEEIKKAGERSAQLTHQLLAFSRQQVLQSNILDLDEVIVETTNLLQRLIGEDIRLETILGATRHIKGDAGQLTQVVINLAVNARDAMPNGGSLTIETTNVFLDEEFAASHFPTKTGSYVMLSVADTGSGMDAETRKIIFEPFYTTKEVGKGTGLGLATVYGIVKQSGGFIWVESEIDAGSTFNVYLPCIDAEIEPQNAGKAIENSTQAAVILVVDDEDLVRALTRQALEECGYRVVDADSGAAALAICREMNCQIDLLITDVVMPGMDGRELAGKLAELCPPVRVLFTSGYSDDSDVRRTVTETGNNFIQKPFTFDALASKVREFLAGETMKEL